MIVRFLKWTILTSWLTLPAAVWGLDTLEKRNATTDVVCQSTYSWMSNQNNQSPCLVASVLSDACAITGDWDVPALGPNDAYSLPNSSTSNACICSWAVYNLLGACTICQGNPNVDNWSPYKAGCGSFTTDTFWSTNYTVPTNTLLPFWAAKDPSTWSGGSFNSNEASSIHSQGKSDINLSPSSQSSSSSTSNAGAIAGGTVGGLAAVAGLVALFFYLRRRKRNKSRKLLDPLPNTTSHTIHGRSLSDTSQATVFKGTDPVGFSPDFRPTASPPNMYTSNSAIALLPRSHVASPSAHSLPYDLSIIGDLASTSPSPQPPPPPPQPAMLSPQASISGGHPPPLENVIVPYTLTSSSQDSSSTDRKRVDGNLYPIFEQQNEYQSGSSYDQLATFMNPPMYTESATSGESSVIRSLAPSRSVDLKGRGHERQGSTDTTESGTTHTHGNGTESSWTPMPRRTEVVRESALSGFSGIMGSDIGPSSVIGVGSLTINSPVDSQAGTNLMSVAGSVIGGDDIA